MVTIELAEKAFNITHTLEELKNYDIQPDIR